MKKGKVRYGMLRAAACVDDWDHHAHYHQRGGNGLGAVTPGETLGHPIYQRRRY